MTDEEIAGFFNDTRPFLQGNLDLRDPQVEGYPGRASAPGKGARYRGVAH